jgi:flagellar hook-associated protein FlgK
MSAFSIGVSGMATYQRLMELTGHNLANAATPGYHRRTAELSPRVTGELGDGVEITQITQVRSGIIEDAILRNTSEHQALTAQHDAIRLVESLLQPGEGSLHDLIDKLFNQLEQLTTNPGDLAQRRVVLNTAAGFISEVNQVNTQLSNLSDSVENEARLLVQEINRIAPQIADLNELISEATIQGTDTSDLKDQRGQLLDKLSEIVDIRIVDQPNGSVAVLAAGVPLVLAGDATPVVFKLNALDQVELSIKNTAAPLSVSGGRLAGLFAVRNHVMPQVRAQTNELTTEIVRNLDSVHATGMGLGGPLRFMSSTRAVEEVGVPLNEAGLAFPVQAGELYVSVTNSATGERTVTRLAIDPATQSLDDVAALFNGVSNLQAVVEPQTRTLKIVARPGYGFDFAGRLPTAPTNSTLSGTATAQLAGNYQGSVNDEWSFTVVGSGTIGVSDSLTLEVRSGSGALLATHNIGAGYEPGAVLPAVNGVSVTLSAGTVNDGDAFGSPVIAHADTANLLAALGLNTFFTGDPRRGYAVHPELLAKPELLAASRSGLSGDGSNLQRMTGLRDVPLMAEGSQSFRAYFGALIGDVGIQVQDLGQRLTAKQALGDSLEAQRQEVSGVDPNEELARLLGYQRSFQASARYIATVNESLNELFNIF